MRTEARMGYVPTAGTPPKPSLQERNVILIQELLKAYGRGEFQPVLDALADDVEWLVPGPEEIPYAGLYQGREQVAGFFRVLAETVDMAAFEADDFVASWDKVGVTGRCSGRVKSNGRAFKEEWAMEFRLSQGKVVRFHEYMDSSSVAAAFRGARWLEPVLA